PAGGVIRVDSAGLVHEFASVPEVDSLHGIAFDTEGAFGHRLLVAGPHANRTTVAAIDCDGTVTVITRQAPVVEGGIAVAPAGFGAFAGTVIAPDELSGAIYAISADGSSRLLAHPGLAAGGDIGVEGVGFVPSTAIAGVTVYFADRGTPGNPHAGTDRLLALAGGALGRAGARPADMLVATEGGAGMVGVRCAASCSWYPVIADNPVSHGEGHVLVLASAPGPEFAPAPAAVRSSSSPAPLGLIAGIGGAAGALVVLLSGLVAFSVRARRRGPR
ncbi:MAG: hypothetical protein M3024_03825, partial [Candidatus Dormibacteraeota bacterium]|nr:hypothetical protein [Candidatus Dormibacteraeota bacterium]